MDAVEQLDEYKAALLYGSASLGLTGSILVRAGEGSVGSHSAGNVVLACCCDGVVGGCQNV